MTKPDLHSTAQALVAPGKGILAADESFPTIEKRFEKLNISATEENRRAYRDMLFAAPSLSQYISGVILFDETIRQKNQAGKLFPAFLEEQGILPGIKVDQGAKDLAGFPGEKITEGLDGLRDRLRNYLKLGARFAKWRAVIKIEGHLPSAQCIEANAHALARYASLCQETGLVPIVEPEVLMDGAHGIDRCLEVTETVLQSVFGHLFRHRVSFEEMLLKPNMVIAGEDATTPASPQEVAEKTLRCLLITVPAAVPGIVFLSGGQTEQAATVHLNAMHQQAKLPWALSFSYGRALQEGALKAWRGSQANLAAAQATLLRRARCNSAARSGQYTAKMETDG